MSFAKACDSKESGQKYRGCAFIAEVTPATAEVTPATEEVTPATAEVTLATAEGVILNHDDEAT